ncbi:hypothetical protein HK405_000332, partial [Cladochytrium tenue]
VATNATIDVDIDYDELPEQLDAAAAAAAALVAQSHARSVGTEAAETAARSAERRALYASAMAAVAAYRREKETAEAAAAAATAVEADTGQSGPQLLRAPSPLFVSTAATLAPSPRPTSALAMSPSLPSVAEEDEEEEDEGEDENYDQAPAGHSTGPFSRPPALTTSAAAGRSHMGDGYHHHDLHLHDSEDDDGDDGAYVVAREVRSPRSSLASSEDDDDDDVAAAGGGWDCGTPVRGLRNRDSAIELTEHAAADGCRAQAAPRSSCSVSGGNSMDARRDAAAAVADDDCWITGIAAPATATAAAAAAAAAATKAPAGVGALCAQRSSSDTGADSVAPAHIKDPTTAKATKARRSLSFSSRGSPPATPPAVAWDRGGGSGTGLGWFLPFRALSC